MEPTLTPHLALAYLRELSTDVHGGIVLGPGSTRLAGEPAIETGARALLRAGGGSDWLQVRASAGWVFAACCAEGAVVLVTGPHALPGLVRHDLGAVVEMLFPEAHGADRGAVPGVASTAGLPGHDEEAATASSEDLTVAADGIHAALSQYADRLGADR